MADQTTQTDRLGYRAPPQGIRDLYFGAGAGVPGMYPLLNQATANYFGTMGMPGVSSFGISTGAVTNNDFVGYGPFKDEPRFGNTTKHSDHVVDFSSRGPGVIGDPKPDLMSIGAYSFDEATLG